MPGSDRDVSSFETAFGQTPKVLHAIRVNLAVNVLASAMIHHSMHVLDAQPLVAPQGVRENVSARHHVPPHVPLKRFLLLIGNDTDANLAATLKNALSNRLANRAPTMNALLSLGRMHELCFAADERFVRLNFAFELFKTSGLHSEPDSVKEEPCGLLRNSDGAGNLTRAYSILGIGDAPDRDKPLVQAKRGILKDGPNFGGELFSAFYIFALERWLPRSLLFAIGPNTGRASFDGADVIGSAFGTSYFAVWPFDPNHVRMAQVQIGKKPDGFDQSLRA
jgi:hypothetical protein